MPKTNDKASNSANEQKRIVIRKRRQHHICGPLKKSLAKAEKKSKINIAVNTKKVTTGKPLPVARLKPRLTGRLVKVGTPIPGPIGNQRRFYFPNRHLGPVHAPLPTFSYLGPVSYDNRTSTIHQNVTGIGSAIGRDNRGSITYAHSNNGALGTDSNLYSQCSFVDQSQQQSFGSPEDVSMS